ncbi:MAG: class I SAM-dependent methyltransferase [Immundisolibacter sp.]|uniref:class I SAM-dependent methyltransferase n=1 Tax=Immundisolibacter sp. TaxID=1934948 RepID=UPI003D0A27D1
MNPATDPDPEAQIRASWQRNAAPWTAAVRGQHIESRRRVTDQAIVDAVTRHAPQRVLDAGCGEGWLTRRLTALGMDVLGVDAEPALIAAAEAQGGGAFQVRSYEALAAGSVGPPFDAVVCNFALLGRESGEALCQAAPTVLKPGGVLIVQTLHPHAVCGDQPYADGWRVGSWDGCGEGFVEPAPWYFRTLESWVRLFVSAGLALHALDEPVHPDSGRVASVIFTASQP